MRKKPTTLAVGWGLAYGKGDTHGLFGSSEFFLVGCKDMVQFLWQFSFAATASTIDSGAVAERMDFKAYLIVSTSCTGLIYPFVAHWIWNPDGWLSKRGYYDFAGSGGVHTLGGVFALVSAIWLGPRIGRLRPNPGATLATIQIKARVELDVLPSFSDDEKKLHRRNQRNKGDADVFAIRVGFRNKHNDVGSGKWHHPPKLKASHAWDLKSTVHANDALTVEVMQLSGGHGGGGGDLGNDGQQSMHVFASAIVPLVKKARSRGKSDGVSDYEDSDIMSKEFLFDDFSVSSSAGAFTGVGDAGGDADDDGSTNSGDEEATGLSGGGAPTSQQGRGDSTWTASTPQTISSSSSSSAAAAAGAGRSLRSLWSLKGADVGEGGSSTSTMKKSFKNLRVAFKKEMSSAAQRTAGISIFKREKSRFLFDSSEESATNGWRDHLPANVPASRKIYWFYPIKRGGVNVGRALVKVKYTLKTAIFNPKVHIELSSPINLLYGSFVLWMGWYGFNTVGHVVQL